MCCWSLLWPFRSKYEKSCTSVCISLLIKIRSKIVQDWNGWHKLTNPFFENESLLIHKSSRNNYSSPTKAIDFIRTDDSILFDNVSKVIHESKFESYNLYNDHEARVHTVRAPNKITAVKGKKHVGFIICSESGTLVIVCVAVKATENCVLSTFLFPRKIFRDHFLRGGPVCCKEAGNRPGWKPE
jgi:hypothetical protein